MTREVEYGPLGKYDDGYKIDGATVRFWGWKKQAQDAARAIGWPLVNVVRVRTRFQRGYAIADTRFGALTHAGYDALLADRARRGTP